MAEDFIARRGKQAASCTGAATLNIETLATGEGATVQRALPRWSNGIRRFAARSTCRSRAGTWFYGGTPFARPALVRLFSTILRKDPKGYVLVTPFEKVGIIVEDAPFLAVEMTVTGEEPERILRFLTNVGDWVEAGFSHPIRFEKGAAVGIKPYVHVRGDLWALLTCTLVLDLVELGEIGEHDGARRFGVASAGSFSQRQMPKRSRVPIWR